MTIATEAVPWSASTPDPEAVREPGPTWEKSVLPGVAEEPEPSHAEAMTQRKRQLPSRAEARACCTSQSSLRACGCTREWATDRYDPRFGATLARMKLARSQFTRRQDSDFSAGAPEIRLLRSLTEQSQPSPCENALALRAVRRSRLLEKGGCQRVAPEMPCSTSQACCVRPCAR